MSLTTGNIYIDSLVHSSWADQSNTAVTITYNFPTELPVSASVRDATGFVPMNGAEQQAVQTAMALWASVANINFVQVATNGNIQFGTNAQPSTSDGYAYWPSSQTTSVNLFTNNTSADYKSFAPGSYGPMSLLTEVGFSLGLKLAYDGGSGLNGPFLPTVYDYQDYSVMAQYSPAAHKLTGDYVTTPMIYDIQAIQYLYGANMQYHAGDDHYVFTPTTLEQCIWDAGGNDVFDFSATTAATTIDLREGHFSSTAPGLSNISIAYNVVIEQAIAGSGDATIYANDAGDTITGGAGNDTITEGAGNDHITGGGGLDTVVFKGALAGYQISAVGSTVTVHGDGVDTLTGITALSFQDRYITVNDLPTLTHALDAQAVKAGDSFSVSLVGAFAQPGTHATPQFSATLADGAALPSWLAFDAQSATFSGTPGAGDAGVYTLQLNATGTTGVTVSDDFTLVVGGPAANLNGTNGNDMLSPGAGSHAIDGGAGIDTVAYGGSAADYTVTTSNGVLTVVNQAGNGSIDTLQNVERVQFADSGLALDANGEAGQIYRIYEAMLKRTPDAGGLGFWLHQLDQGTGVLAVANDFITSAEFTSIYGSAVSDSDFVTALYANVLHRAPDAGGDAYWVDALAHGVTRAQMLVGFSDSSENIAAFVGVIPVAQTYVPVAG